MRIVLYLIISIILINKVHIFFAKFTIGRVVESKKSPRVDFVISCDVLVKVVCGIVLIDDFRLLETAILIYLIYFTSL